MISKKAVKETETEVTTGEVDIKSMNIHQRLHAITENVKTLAKDGDNKFHKYKYATEAQYVQALRPLLSKYRVSVFQKIVHLQPTPGRDDLITALVEYTYTNIDNPTEQVVTTMAGSGSDNGDKAIAKAITMAKKYAMANTFMIATGDDPEADEETDKRSAAKETPKTTTPKSNGFASAVASKGFGV